MGELKRVLGGAAGNSSEDFGVPHSKLMGPGTSGELKQLKESVQDGSRKARDRSKMFRESISKLDRYREALSSKKRERSDLSSERGSGVNLTKMGSQIHKISDDNMTQREVKTSNSMLNKRTRTLVADTREDNRPASIRRQQMITENGNLIHTLGGGSIQNEEKTHRLLAGVEGLDQKIKRKRSIGTVGNRVITGERDVKRATLPTGNTDLKLRFSDAQGFSMQRKRMERKLAKQRCSLRLDKVEKEKKWMRKHKLQLMVMKKLVMMMIKIWKKLVMIKKMNIMMHEFKKY